MFWNLYQSSNIAAVEINGAGISDSGAIGTQRFESGEIHQNTSIVITMEGWFNTPNIESKKPQYVVDLGNRERIETAVLSAENVWYKLWTELPRTDEDGDEVVYFVEEEPVDGDHTSYMQNGGIQSGTITVMNRKNSEDYQLPFTGSGESLGILIFGMSMMILGFRKMRESMNK